MDFKFPINWYFEKFFGNKAGGGSWKNPQGQGGGSQNVHVCPQGGRGSKNPKKLSTWFIDDPITHLSINGPSDREGQVKSALIN